MKNVISLILIFLVNISIVYADVKIPIEITKIYDGDTIEAKIDNNKFKIRLIGIDCYETCKIHRAYKQAYENNLSVDDVIKQGKVSTLYLKIYMRKTKTHQYPLILRE